MASLIQVRRDTLSNWNSNNPVLAIGEIAFVTDQNRFKVGDGTTSFSSLEYLKADAYIDSVILGTDTTGNYVATVSGTDGLSVSGSGTETAEVTITNTDKGSSQNIFKNITDGSNTASADSNNDTFTISSGTGVSVVVDSSTDTATISNTGVTSVSGTANEVEVSSSTGSITIGLPNTINSATTGNAATATKLESSRTIELTGDVTGSASFDGSSNASISATIAANSVALGTDTTGDYVSTLSGTANQINVSGTGTEGREATLSLSTSVVFPGTVTLNSDPTQALQAATKQYVDALAEGLHIHASVGAATTANISDLSAPPSTIDGVTLVNNLRVLVKNQSTTSQNGIYIYDSENDDLVRASDFNSSSEIQGGDFVFVTGGSINDNTGWVQTEVVITLGTDPIIWQQFSGTGTYTAGTGLSLNGTQFNNTGVISLTGTANEVEVSASSGDITLSLPSSINSDTTGNSATSTKLATARSIALSGDATGSANFDGSADTTISLTLANSGVSAGTYNNSASQVRPFTVDAKGRITSIGTAVSIAIAQSSVTNLTTDLAAKAPLASPALTGTPTAPTAAVNTNTTQIATTAYVVGQGYAKLASPTFTGTVVLPSTTSIGNVSSTEIGYLDGATSSIQNQLNAKASLSGATFTGTVSGVSPTATDSNGFRNIVMSTSEPTGGSDGDVWIVYQ